MPNISITDTQGQTRIVDVQSGLSLMETLRDLGYEEILAMCGGCCSCATCHVYIDDSKCETLTPMEEDEQMIVEMTDNYNSESSRLSCQIELGDGHKGLQVTIVETD
ncbi:MAG: 2Fe-2S iron-sulfur cluster binding domain-containing protein [Acidiferrobacterales bacterium]|nr:2Fe-2S iron-sulfur cluster binding domain-containing protein [Acidiferrobacterales bacterium]